MHWQTVVICIVTTAVSVASQSIEGVDDEDLNSYFTSPSTTTEEEECECLPFYQCLNGTINEFGAGVVDIRGRACSSSLQQCCFLHVTTEGPDIHSTEGTEIPPTAPTACGIRNTRGIGFEITGITEGEANFAEFPWMVALMVTRSGVNVYTCGGSLISHQVVLTAAHCIGDAPASSWLVRAGEWDTVTTEELHKHQDRGVQRIIKHEHFKMADVRNDVALLVLDSPLDPEAHIGITCLPYQGEIFDHSRCFATGWGKEKFGQDSLYQNILKSIELPIMPREDCVKAFRNTRLGPYFQLHNSFICAGGERDKDVCKGDGGGPLVCPIVDDPNRYVQAGIVAWGIGCGEEGVPGAYAAVAQFRNWIDDQMTKLGFGTESYTFYDETS